MFDLFAKNTLVPLVLRLGLAVIFIYHGLDKVTGPGNDGGLNWMKKPEPKADAPELKADAPEQHEPPPPPVQGAVAWGELIGGIALAVGFLTRLAALGIAAIMAGAIYTVHATHGFSLAKGGYEYNFAILVMCLAVFLAGSGPLGVDHLFRLRRKAE